MKLILALILCITVVASAMTAIKMNQCLIDKNCEIKGAAGSDPQQLMAASVKNKEAIACLDCDQADQCVYM